MSKEKPPDENAKAIGFYKKANRVPVKRDHNLGNNKDELVLTPLQKKLKRETRERIKRRELKKLKK